MVPLAKAPLTAARAAPRAKISADLCSLAREITDASIARAEKYAFGVMESLSRSGAYTGPKHVGPIDSYVISDWISCVATPRGAWATVLVKAQLAPVDDRNWSGDFYLDGTLGLVHVDRAGQIAHAEIHTEASAQQSGGEFFHRELFAPGLPNCCSFVFGGLEPSKLFDFDGDGEPEIHVAASYGHEGVSDEWDELFTFQAGLIKPYAPAEPYSFSEMVDVTSDGRPDLTLSYVLSGRDQCGSGFPGDGRGPTFIAHSLPDGGFSSDDEQARAYAKRECPAPPAAIESHRDVSCARLWGRSREELERLLRARFVAWDCAAEAAGRAQNPRAREDYELMLSAARSPIPFTLR
jgi:hypothetical protein